VEFEVAPVEVEELSGGDPHDDVAENALRKAGGAARPGALVLGCDTEVVIDGRALGKPAGEAQAREFLELLSGRSHEVFSALAVLGPAEGQERVGSCSSTVSFRGLEPEEVDRYLASGEWRERAGGYAIQGLGSTLVAAVEGDVTNVIGLPVGLLIELAPELLG
jgi:septum formation protein